MRRNVLCPLSAAKMKDWQFCQGPDAMHPEKVAELKVAGREAKRILQNSAEGERAKRLEDTRYGPFPCAFWDGEQCAILTIAESLNKRPSSRQ